MGYLGLENVSDIIVEYGDGVSPSHWQGDESECPKGGLKGSEVARCLCQAMLVISNV